MTGVIPAGTHHCHPHRAHYNGSQATGQAPSDEVHAQDVAPTGTAVYARSAPSKQQNWGE